jgi:hypothetical protein
LVHEINAVKLSRILEVGTCKGERAEMMIRAAQKYRARVEYIGFDLFEAPPESEFSARTHPWPLKRVRDRLMDNGAAVTLIPGDTRKTLPAHVGVLDPVDFVFLDGGHSEETVAHAELQERHQAHPCEQRAPRPR